MKAPLPDDRIDDEASRAFADHFGTRATQLPPLAIVIAAYNEEGSIGPVLEALPQSISGLEVAKVVVSDGSMDATVKDAEAAGALVCEDKSSTTEENLASARPSWTGPSPRSRGPRVRGA